MLLRYSYFVAAAVLALLLILPYLGISFNKNKNTPRYNVENAQPQREEYVKPVVKEKIPELDAEQNIKDKNQGSKLADIEDLLNGKN